MSILYCFTGTGTFYSKAFVLSITRYTVRHVEQCYRNPPNEHTSVMSPLKAPEGVHYDDVIMGAIASQNTSLTIVYSIVYSDADKKKHQSSASLAFVRKFTGDRWIPRTNGQLRGKCFHLITSSWDMGGCHTWCAALIEHTLKTTSSCRSKSVEHFSCNTQHIS